MTTTGYTDAFQRTVASGLGTADSGQTYTYFAGAAPWSCTGGVATVATAALTNYTAIIDSQSQSADITGQVSLNAIPATNLATIGFMASANSATSCFLGSMMVATGGAISLRFSKVIGGLVTLSTVATGLTYVANTVYNLRYQIFWSRSLQTNVMSLKLWALNTTEPGGWMATTTDASLTDYTAGTQIGLVVRDESTVAGTISGKFRNVSSLSYHLPIPATTDTLCADPAVAYPKQTALESLADAADVAVESLSGLADLAAAFPRVRVSNSNVTLVNQFSVTCTFNATEFNIGTPTNLGYDPTAVVLPYGIWLLTFEIRYSSLSLDSVLLELYGTTQNQVYARSWPSKPNDNAVYGTGHISVMVAVANPLVPLSCIAALSPSNTSTTIAIQYMALSAIKISDYFV